jgi:hypothetical protein
MSRRHLFAVAALALVVAVASVVAPVRGDGWSPQLAAKYLDDRQRDWFAWPRAASPDGPCVSCHTGMPYLIARPKLRALLKETQPTMYESGLIARLQSHAGEKPTDYLQAVETIFAAMFVTEPAAKRRTFEQLFTLQKRSGELQGGWQWFAADLDPWETPAQIRWGGALAALAIGSESAARDADRIGALSTYLQDDAQSRPLHVRLAMVWASTKLPQAMTTAARQATLDEIVRTQQSDGGWTVESLGPWNDHPAAPPSPAAGASHSYATAFTAFVLSQVGGRALRAPSDRALAWLKAHQDRQTGAWPAVSMNKKYPPGSMEEKFLQDAATAFAAAALASE